MANKQAAIEALEKLCERLNDHKDDATTAGQAIEERRVTLLSSVDDILADISKSLQEAVVSEDNRLQALVSEVRDAISATTNSNAVSE